MENTDPFSEEEKSVLGLLEQVTDFGISFAIVKDSASQPNCWPETVVISKYLETEDKVLYRLQSTQVDESTSGLLATLHLIINALAPRPGAKVEQQEIWTPGKPTGKLS